MSLLRCEGNASFKEPSWIPGNITTLITRWMPCKRESLMMRRDDEENEAEAERNSEG